jgi:hypothetical protein
MPTPIPPLNEWKVVRLDSFMESNHIKIVNGDHLVQRYTYKEGSNLTLLKSIAIYEDVKHKYYIAPLGFASANDNIGAIGEPYESLDAAYAAYRVAGFTQ